MYCCIEQKMREERVQMGRRRGSEMQRRNVIVGREKRSIGLKRGPPVKHRFKHFTAVSCTSVVSDRSNWAKRRQLQDDFDATPQHFEQKKFILAGRYAN